MLLWQEIDLGVLAACIGELLHKFVLSLVEPSCSGVPEIMLIKRVRGGKLPRAHGTGRLILTVPNNPLLTGMSNHSWQLRNQFYFAIYVHLFSFFYWFYCPYMSLYLLMFGCFSFCNMLLGFRLGGQGLLQLLQLRRMLGLKRLRGMDVGSRRSNPIWEAK